MLTYQARAPIVASPDAVWSVLADVPHWDQWTPTVTRVEPLDGTTVAIGARFRVHQPRLRPTIWTVTTVQAPSHFTWEARTPGMLMVAEHMLRPVSPGQVEVVLSFHFGGVLGAIIGRLTASLVRSYLATEATSLRKRVESQRPNGGASSP